MSAHRHESEQPSAADRQYQHAARHAELGHADADARLAVFNELFQTQQLSGAGFSRYAEQFNANPQHMENLGLPGLSLVGFGQDHSVITRDSQNHVHRFNPANGQELRTKQESELIHSGSRFFQRNADGSLSYTVQSAAGKHGNERDYNWNIARDGLAAQTGRDPSSVSASELDSYFRQMQKANPHVDFNRIRPGDVVTLPPSAPSGENFSPQTRIQQVDSRTGDALAPGSRPTFGGLGVEDGIDGQRPTDIRNGQTNPGVGFNGTNIEHTTGELNQHTFAGRWIGRENTHFSRNDVTNPDGALVQREISYAGDGITMNPNGVKIENVTRLNVSWNATGNNRNGEYVGIIDTKGGQSYRVHFDRNGQMTAEKPEFIATP